MALFLFINLGFIGYSQTINHQATIIVFVA